MVCYHPVRCWISKTVNPSGKRSLVHNISQALQSDDPKSRKCGQCSGCNLDKSREWAIRCCHEASLYKENVFITITYDDDHLPSDRSLDHSHFQNFMKSLRDKFKYVGADGKNPIRNYMCGEYGTLNGRPHYHACLFNVAFDDKKLWKIVNNNRLYVSDTLEKLWKKGFCTVGDVTFESAAYVARYMMDRIRVSDASPLDAKMRWMHKYVDFETGEVRKEEYNEPSRRPGLGKGFFDLYSSDIFPHDYIVLNGVKQRAPKYYDGLLELTRPYEFDCIKERREKDARTSSNWVDNNTLSRLHVREQVKSASMKLLKREV